MPVEKIELILQLLALVLSANAAPVVARWVFGEFGGRPLDGGRCWRDKRPMLGTSKTLRGIMASLLVSVLAAATLGFSFVTGILVALGAMGGDLLSSFLKRRLNIPSHGSAPGLDQLPESVFPLLLIMPVAAFGWTTLVIVVVLFYLVESILSALIDKLERRSQP